ncbi:MAG: hypothetical protein ACPIOQ_22205, partial [Promethearchaeia archaeon]
MLAAKGRVLSSGHSVCTSGVDDTATAQCASDSRIFIDTPVYNKHPWAHAVASPHHSLKSS